jgi:hypothetical protein
MAPFYGQIMDDIQNWCCEQNLAGTVMDRSWTDIKLVLQTLRYRKICHVKREANIATNRLTKEASI